MVANKMEYLDEDRKVCSIDSTLSDVIEDLPKIFKNYDEIYVLKPLDDYELDAIADLSIPDGKVLYVNPTECSDLNERYELLLWNPGIWVCDERWAAFDIKKRVDEENLADILNWEPDEAA